MQFKAVKNRIQVVAYRGYDREKRRAVVKMLGSIDRHTYEPSDGLLDSLTDDEKKELQTYIDEKRQSDISASRQHDVNHIARRIADVAAMIEDGVVVSDADEVWQSVALLSRALRRAGHPKPRPAPAPAPAADDRQQSLPECTPPFPPLASPTTEGSPAERSEAAGGIDDWRLS